MCGRHCADAAVMQIVQNRNRQCRTLSRVGPAPSSSNRHRESASAFARMETMEVMGGKGTQALLNALFVTDICEKPL